MCQEDKELPNQKREISVPALTEGKETASISLLTGNAMKVKDELPRVQPVKASGEGKGKRELWIESEISESLSPIRCTYCLVIDCLHPIAIQS